MDIPKRLNDTTEINSVEEEESEPEEQSIGDFKKEVPMIRKPEEFSVGCKVLKETDTV